MPEDWPAIAEHGLIGDLRTCALVTTDGTIDWFCAPRFDSPSVFGAILDTDDGGCWRLAPVGEVSRTQRFYFPDTAILITRFLTPDGVAEVHDFMPVLGVGDPARRQRLVRRVSGVRGTIALRMCVDARPDYGRRRCRAQDSGDGVLITGDGVRPGLIASTDLTIEEGGDNTRVSAEFQLSQGDTALFVLELLDGSETGGELPSCNTIDMTDHLLTATTSY